MLLLHLNHFNFCLSLHKIPVPAKLKLCNREINDIYNIYKDKLAYLYFKDLFPETFDFLNSSKDFQFLTMSMKDYQKIAKTVESLHRIFKTTTRYVLNQPELYKQFNILKSNWRLIKDNFDRTCNFDFYGRMDIGISFDLSHFKLFEYNTGLCGDIYDTTDHQNAIFNFFFLKNKNKFHFPQSFHNSIPCGFDLLNQLGYRWKILTSDCKNKTVYILYNNDKNEELILESFKKAFKLHNIKYKLCLNNKGIFYNEKDNCIYDSFTKEKIDIIYKTNPWYIIFKMRNEMKNIYLNKNTKIVEPMWKTVMGSKALLPYVYLLNMNNKNILPCSFDPFDKCFGDDKFVIEKSFTGRASMNTYIVNRNDIKTRKNGVIYQKVFKEGNYKNNFYIMGAYVVAGKHGGFYIKQSNKMINDYRCDTAPTRILI